MYNLLAGLSEILEHQSQLQKALYDKFKPYQNIKNVGFCWADVHFGINSLDNIIEEAVEAKRHLKIRKWWSTPESTQANLESIYGQTKTRLEFIEELADIFITWLNVLVYFNIDAREFIGVLEAKLEKNNPESPKSDIGNRS